jgi:hypothetical protein
MKQRFDMLFSTMTDVETTLWAGVAAHFERAGLRTAFLLFDESARVLVERHGIAAFSFFELLDATPAVAREAVEERRFVESFGIENVRHAYLHDKLAYGRPDEAKLYGKTLRYLETLDRFFTEYEVETVFQEMGGFVACNAVYRAARKHRIPHIFYEPAPFAGRVVFTLNDHLANVPADILGQEPTPEARARAAESRRRYLEQPAYVVPAKDRHSFRDMTVGRMFNAMNARRLSGKLWRKYVTREREEFNEIGFVVRKNLMKLVRRRLFSRHYTDAAPASLAPYLYYPFHVPHDVQLTVRSKLFFFQEALVEYISRILPPDYRIVVKEHPAAIGGHPYRLLRQLLRDRPNVVLLHPRHGSHGVIAAAEAVITVNSKVGFEAMMQGARAIVLGEAFYRGKGLTYDIASLNDLEAELPRALRWEPPSQDAVLRFLGQIHDWSYPCELFDPGATNVATASASLSNFLERRGLPAPAGATPSLATG